MLKVITFIKRNIFSFICVLLATLVFITGSAYSRYVSVDSFNKIPTAGNFAYSAEIEDATPLSFGNTEYWNQLDTEKVAMNTMRSLSLAVNNFDLENGEKKVSDVKMKYDLTFTSPVNFSEHLAIQLLDEERNAVLPQLVMTNVLSAPVGTIIRTENFVDFNAVETTDLAFVITETTDENDNVTRKLTSGEIEIKIEKIIKETDQTIQFRVWDVTDETDALNPIVDAEVGKLLAPLIVTYTEDVEYYKFTISHPDFKFYPGFEQTHRYNLEFVPTKFLHDMHLGGYFADEEGQWYRSLYAGEQITLHSTLDEATDTYANGATHSFNEAVPGSGRYYVVGEEIDGDTSIYRFISGEDAFDRDVSDTTETTVIETVRDTSTSTDPVNYYTNEVAQSTERIGNTTYYPFTVDVEKVERVQEVRTIITERVTTLDIVDTTSAERITTLAVSDDGYITQSVEVSKTIEKYQEITVERTTKTITTVKTVTSTGTRKFYTTRSRSGGRYVYTYQPNLTSGGQNVNTVTWNSSVEGEIESQVEDIEKVDNTYFTSPETTQEIEMVDRLIRRHIHSATITINSICREDKVYNENDEPVDEYIYYTEDSPFTLFEENGEQKYYISQCFTKNYPVSLNVHFEQIQ